MIRSASREILRRFENEAKAAGAIQHRHVATIHDAGVDADGTQYIVMELLKGQDCAKLLHAEGMLPIRRAVISSCRRPWELQKRIGWASSIGTSSHRICSSRRRTAVIS